MKYFLSVLFAVSLLGCAPMYHPIQPLGLRFDTTPAELANGQVSISYRYNVLKESRNRRYAKEERFNGVSLIGIRIDNNSNDTLYFPDDITVFAGRDTLYLLTEWETREIIRQRKHTDRDLYLEGDMSDILFSIGENVINSGIEMKANEHFADELATFYLMPSYIAPGTSTIGLLTVDVKSGTPLVFEIAKPAGN